MCSHNMLGGPCPACETATIAAERDLFRGKISQYRELVRMLMRVVDDELGPQSRERRTVIDAAEAMLAEEIPL